MQVLNVLQCSEGNVAVGFSGVRGYEGPCSTPGFSFNVPVQEAVDAFEPGDLRKGVTILDIVAWADYNRMQYIQQAMNIPDILTENIFLVKEVQMPKMI